MKIGNYVRTKYGIKKITDIICGQDIRFDNTDGFDEDLLKYHDYDEISKNSHTWEEIVIGEPKEKIIELIEVGDLVKYNPMMNGYIKKQTFCKMIKDTKDLLYFKYQIEHRKANFVSIVTKEQFESMEYKIGD